MQVVQPVSMFYVGYTLFSHTKETSRHIRVTCHFLVICRPRLSLVQDDAFGVPSELQMVQRVIEAFPCACSRLVAHSHPSILP
jgi:hypothetical protein